MNWKWPATEENYLNPWYVILWRLTWFPFILVGYLITMFGICMTEGCRSAHNYWNGR